MNAEMEHKIYAIFQFSLFSALDLLFFSKVNMIGCTVAADP